MLRRKLLGFRDQEHHFLKNKLLYVVLHHLDVLIGRGGTANNKAGNQPTEALLARNFRDRGRRRPRRGGPCPEIQQAQLRVHHLRQDLRLTLLRAELRRKLLAPRQSAHVRLPLHSWISCSFQQ